MVGTAKDGGSGLHTICRKVQCKDQGFLLGQTCVGGKLMLDNTSAHLLASLTTNVGEPEPALHHACQPHLIHP
jgi:hypothetical protein